MQYVSNSFEETKKIAAEFADGLKGGEVIFLRGGLGSGKTTFVKGLVEKMAGQDIARSPTFTIINEYPVGGPVSKIVHMDCYRFKDVTPSDELGLLEYFTPETIVLIEWPEILAGSRIKPTHEIVFSYVNPGKRTIEINVL